jgi:hypothetical protein
MKFALEKTAHQAQRGPDHPAHPLLRETQRAQPRQANVNDMVEESVELADIELRRRNEVTHHVAALPP